MLSATSMPNMTNTRRTTYAPTGVLQPHVESRGSSAGSQVPTVPPTLPVLAELPWAGIGVGGQVALPPDTSAVLDGCVRTYFVTYRSA